jgi:hypothetical protein
MSDHNIPRPSAQDAGELRKAALATAVLLALFGLAFAR